MQPHFKVAIFPMVFILDNNKEGSFIFLLNFMTLIEVKGCTCVAYNTGASKYNRKEKSEPKLPLDMTNFSGTESIYAFGVEQRPTFWTPAASFIDPRSSKIKLCSTPNPGRKSTAQFNLLNTNL